MRYREVDGGRRGPKSASGVWTVSTTMWGITTNRTGIHLYGAHGTRDHFFEGGTSDAEGQGERILQKRSGRRDEITMTRNSARFLQPLREFQPVSESGLTTGSPAFVRQRV